MGKQLILVFVAGVIFAGAVVWGVNEGKRKNENMSVEKVATEFDDVASKKSTIVPTAAETEKSNPESTVESSAGDFFLSVTSPLGGAKVSAGTLKVVGKSVAGAEIYVNEMETLADSTGNFSTTVTIEEGENYIIVLANDSDGNWAEQEIIIEAE